MRFASGFSWVKPYVGTLALALLFAAPAYAKYPEGVRVDQVSFNPSAGESVGLHLAAVGSAETKVSIYDPDGGLIRTLIVPGGEAEDEHLVTWDGRDESGQPVPDETYTFVVEGAVTSQ